MGVSTILGPAMNIKRSPLCGRNFEYYSEDPYVSSELAAAMIQGVQSQNVGTSAKHFLANNQEKHRMTNSSEVDERALREIYLASFEGTVKKAKPWTVMNSYNRINGTFVGDSREYLTDILRGEWGFDGYVVSDWGAVNDRVEALKAGLDLEMPSSNGINDQLIIDAVKNGVVEESVVDQACERILDVIFRYAENRDETAVFDYEKDHALAASLEAECMVLLKNEGHILPLDAKKKIAFIGKYAETPRYQGGGSSHINSWKVESALEAVQGIAEITFAKGFDDVKDETDEQLLKEEFCKAISLASLFSMPQLERDGLLEYLKEAKEKEIPVFADLASDKQKQGLTGIQKFLPYIDYFLPSLYDALAMTGAADAQEAAEKYRSLGVKCVVIKCGKDGCYYAADKQSGHIPAPSVHPADTTGAGDCMSALFISRILKGCSVETACRFACAGATYSTLFPGASEEKLTENRISEFYSRTKEGADIYA